MQESGDRVLTPPSAPPRARPDGVAAVPLPSYGDVVRTARLSVVPDFQRQRQHRALVDGMRRTGGDAFVLRAPDAEPSTTAAASASGVAPIVRVSSSRTLKEHTVLSWSASLWQTGLFGLFVGGALTSALTLYVGICHSRVLLPLAPLSVASTGVLWTVVEGAWRDQRLADHAAHIRAARQGHPSALVARPANAYAAEPPEPDSG